MHIDEFRSFEVIRNPEEAAMSHILDATTTLLRTEQELTTEFGLRPSLSKGVLALLGTHKMILAARNAHPSSPLYARPYSTLSQLSDELTTSYSRAIDVSVGEIDMEEEFRNQTGYQTVVFANVAALRPADDIGQEYAAHRLREVAKTPTIWAHLARIPLLYGSASLLDDAYAKDRITVETKNALGTLHTISYSGAKRPRQRKIA